MLEASGLYQLEYDGDPSDSGARVLLSTMGPLVDGGHVAAQIAKELLGSLDSEVVARLDVDQLIDYRSRRPALTFDRDRYSDSEVPEIVLHRLVDLEGTPFLLLDGPEPDYQWVRGVAAVTELIEDFGIDLTVFVHGIPMGVPHTRPVGITQHATSPHLIPDNHAMFGQLQVPGSFSGLLELRLGESGHDAIGLSVHVPHYLAQADAPEAALAGLKAIIAATGLDLPTTTMAVAAGVARAAIDAEVAESHEVGELVAALEEQYDQFVAGLGPSIAPSLEDLPTPDEIGAEFERFLRAQDD